MRHRGELVALSSQHVQHMHKALTQMNVQLQHVISDLTGLTGMTIVDAILDGQRDPDELVKLRDPGIRAEASVVRKSLVGNWRGEHLFYAAAVAGSLSNLPATHRGVRPGAGALLKKLDAPRGPGAETAARGRQKTLQCSPHEKDGRLAGGQ